MSLYDKIVLKGYKSEPYSFKDTLNESLEFLYKTYGIRLLLIAVLFAVVCETTSILYQGYDVWLNNMSESSASRDNIISMLLNFITLFLSTMFIVDFYKRLRGEKFNFKSIFTDGLKGFSRLIFSIVIFIFISILTSIFMSVLMVLLPFTILIVFALLAILLCMISSINYSLVEDVNIPFSYAMKRGYETVIHNGYFVLRLVMVFVVNFIIAWTFANISSILVSDNARLISKIIESILGSFISLNLSAFIAFSFIYYAEPLYPHRFSENSEEQN